MTYVKETFARGCRNEDALCKFNPKCQFQSRGQRKNLPFCSCREFDTFLR